LSWCRRGVGSLSRLAETEDEHAARKAAKEAKKVASMFGYSSHRNPFGDQNLHQQFVWHKKSDKDGAKGESSQKHERRIELIREIEKVRKRRDDREKEQEEMERLKAEEVSPCPLAQAPVG
jgi:hypothetical protein